MSNTSFTVRNKKKYKLILLGDQSVGKTCLLQRFINDKFQQIETSTVGIDFVVTNISHDNQNYRLQLWDTAGQERFKSLIPSYLRDANCGIILYDVSKKQTFDGVYRWLNLFKEHVEESSMAVVVANKTDLKMRFSNHDKIKGKCIELGLHYFEVSAKTGSNVKQLFHSIVQLIVNKQSEPILNGKILQGSSSQNLSRVTEQSINFKLSPRKNSWSFDNGEGQSQKLDKRKIGNNQFQNKGRCC